MTAELLKRSTKNNFAGLSSHLFKDSAGDANLIYQLPQCICTESSPSCRLAFKRVTLLLSKRLRLLFRRGYAYE
jgi:hypothetical protein